VIRNQDEGTNRPFVRQLHATARISAVFSASVTISLPQAGGTAGAQAAPMRKTMSYRRFSIIARWDDEAKVYYSESDIVGLHVEAATIEEFHAEVDRLAVDLIAANHPLPAQAARRGAASAIFVREQVLAVA
jgi:hypothetical protein